MLSPPKRRLVTAVVYAAVVLQLLGLSLFARGFSRTLGDAQVSGRAAAFSLFGTGNVRNLTVSWNGISLRFSHSSHPALEGFEPFPGGGDIVFAGGSRLRLIPAADAAGSLSIVGAAAASTAPSTIDIPYSFSGVQLASATGGLAWTRNGRHYVLSIPKGAVVHGDAGSLTVPVSADLASSRMLLSEAGAPVPPAQSAVAQRPVQAVPSRLPDEKSMTSTAELTAALSGFADAAYKGWTSTRFVASDATWKMPDGTSAFSDAIGVGLLAESIARGTWQTEIALWNTALARWQSQNPGAQAALLSSAYTGDLRAFAASFQASAASQVDRVRSLLSRSDNALLSLPGLIPLLADHGGDDILPQTLAFLTSRIAAALEPSLGLGLLEALLDASLLSQPPEELAGAVKQAVERRILPSVASTDAGLFFQSGAGGVDVASSLRAGSLLLRAGGYLGSSFDAAVGRDLIASSLSLAGADGVLPAALTLKSGHLASRSGSLTPESVYRLLPLGRQIPREMPLDRQIGTGLSIWTAADLVSAQLAGNVATLVLAFPVGIPHYLLIQGLHAFTQIQLHGIPWHSDPTYYRYSDGWDFDAATATLSMKITGRLPRERIVLQF